jgi:DNA-binding response OmpR family regulator
MNRIALLEDHERLSALVCHALSNSGIEVDVFVNIDLAWRAVSATAYSVLVVDRGLPDGDGLTLIKRLRERGFVMPCLILTARDALHDRVEGLESGADDYLVKPFSMQELVARIRALMRRPAALQELSPSFGGLKICPDAGCMECGSEVIGLAPAEIQIMILLIKFAGQSVRRTALEAAAWGITQAVTPNAIDVVLHRLRKKLLVIGSSLQIVNVRGVGYVLRQGTHDA